MTDEDDESEPSPLEEPTPLDPDGPGEGEKEPTSEELLARLREVARRIAERLGQEPPHTGETDAGG
jgi:hypothetical protein